MCPGLQGAERNFAVPACVALFPSRFDMSDPNRVEQFQQSSVYSYAGYLEGAYALSDQLTFTAGGRLTIDKKTANGYTRGDIDWIFNPVQGGTPGGFEGTEAGWRVEGLSETWTAFTPRVILDWKPNEDHLFYGSVSRGFRSGAYQYAASQLTSVVPIEPEFVWNYEIGVKNQFLDNRAQLNIAAFQANYKGAQFFYFDNQTGEAIFDNAGKARVRGVEVEATVNPIRNLNLFAYYTYQKGRINGFPEETGVPNGITPAQTPKHSINLGASYDIQLAGGGELSIAGDLQHKSKYQLDLVEGDPAFTTRVKSLVNGSISYTTPNGMWRLSIWGKNLTNEDVLVHGNDFRFMMYTFDEAYNSGSPNFNPAAASAVMARYLPPRTFGASLNYSF